MNKMRKKLVSIFLKLIKAVFILLILVILGFLARPVWNHMAVYPHNREYVAELQKLRKEPANRTGLNVYRGVMHLHSFLSHDSEGNLNDLIPAAKFNGIDFMFLTDHPRFTLDTFPRGYHGTYDGVIIKPGSEKHGFVTWPMDSVVLDLSADKDTLIKQVVHNGGIMFYSHTEEPHNWDNPYYQGMEIYNFHTDTKDEKLVPHLFNFLINGSKYRIWALREMFNEQTEILALWDSLNTRRKIVGFSAVDTHENQNIRARYIPDGRVEWLGPNCNVIDTVKVTFLNRWMFGEPDQNGWIFKMMIDTYKEGFDYVTNYLFADTLTVSSLADHLLKGHLFMAFKTLGDAKGFNFYGINKSNRIQGIMGDSLSLTNTMALHAVSPLPGQFRLIHNGKPVKTSQTDGYEFRFEEPLSTGVWRMEVHLNIRGKYLPWIYSNPVYLY